MNQEKLNKLKGGLEKERDELLAKIKSGGREDFGSDVDHGDEEADEAESMGEDLAKTQAFKERLEEVEGALRKIADGKYAPCESCDSEIGDDILNASPASKICKNCK